MTDRRDARCAGGLADTVQGGLRLRQTVGLQVGLAFVARTERVAREGVVVGARYLLLAESESVRLVAVHADRLMRRPSGEQASNEPSAEVDTYGDNGWIVVRLIDN